MNFNKFKIAQIITLAIVLFGTIFIHFFSGNTNFDKTKRNSEKEIAAIYDALETVSKNQDLNINSLNIDSFIALEKELPFDLFVYENGKLIFWNENKAIPDLKVDNLSSIAQQINLNNGYYIALKKTKGNRDYVALSLLRYSYNLVNKYLSNSFSKQFKFQDSDIILPIELEKGVAVKDPLGNTIFRIQHTKQNQNILDNFRLFLSVLIVICFFIISINWANYALKKKKIILGLAGLIFLGLLFLMALKMIPFEFNKLVLFSPKLYGSNVFESLGFLFLIGLYSFGIAYYFFIHIVLEEIKLHKLFQLVLLIISISLFIFLNITLKTLVFDSIINFGSKNLTLFNVYAIFGLVVALISCLVFLFVHLAFLYEFRLNKFRIYIVAFQSLISIVILYKFSFGILAIGVGFLYLLYSIIVLTVLKKDHTNKTLIIIIVSLFFAIIQVSGLVREFTLDKQEDFKKTIAFKKSRQRDVEAEDQFGKIALKIQDDELIKKFFQFPMISYKDVYKRMNFLYFGGYFSKYNVSIVPLNIDGKPIKTNSEENLEDFYNTINSFGEATLNENLIFIQDKTQQFSYISLLQIQDNKNVEGTLAIKFTPKTYDIGNVYPELLLEGKKDIIDQYEEDFEFAIYIDDNLISQSNEFPYISDISEFTDSKYIKDGYQHQVYKIDNEKKIIISSKEEKLFDIISIFSFVLCFYLILGFFVVLVYFNLTSKQYQKFFNLSFRKRIAIAMLFIVILSFFGIGLATVSYFSDQYNSYHKKRLIRKQKSINYSLAHLIDKNKLNTSDRFYKYFLSSLNSDILEISDIHKMDLNIFNTNGQLLKSSQDGIFSSGLLSNIMSPEAYVMLNNEKKSLVVQEESIGNLNYLSAYIPILDEAGKNMAYLNVPYFAKEKNLNQDISNFMIALINVYVLLLIIASFIAFFVSNSITNPLKVISNKLKDIKLTQKNETINWKQEDEIGALVKEYNRMILQLEQNAKLLAKSERDTAWREMAKQIAHEIKNPLTPMKLSIQYLQRILNDDKDKGADLAVKVSKTLIEQIDNLSDIATAFSSFAKMPKGDKVEIDLVEVIDSAADLFKHDKINLIKDYEITSPKVLANKNQMISVFNNLIKNAIQATVGKPERNIEVKLKLDDDFYLVSISDNGIGITSEQKHKVFVPNFTTKSSGTGLGLAISKQIVENADGDIWFESEYKVGTIFYVKIPKFVNL